MVFPLVSLENIEGISVIRLSRGATNAIDLVLVQELKNTVKKVHEDSSHGLVLTSANDKFFSIGFDIPLLLALPREEFTNFYQTFNQLCLDLFTLPKPSAAALTGHAIAGGCILALACDYRFIAEGRKLIGLNEAKLGVPVPYFADHLLHSLIGGRYAREVLELGELYLPEDAIQNGLVDQISPLKDVLHQAIERVRTLADAPGNAFITIKANRVEPVEVEIRAKLERKEQLFIDCWYSEEARRALEDAASKF